MPEIAIARSFFPSVTKLALREQGLVMAFIQKLMEEHIRSGTSLERVQGARLPNIWSARIGQDLRAILYQEGNTYLLLYADHHDAAYSWATRRQLHHDAQNRLQIIETVERSVEVEVHVHVDPPLFAPHDDAYLLSLGLPKDWLPALREVRDQDQLLTLCMSLPEEVGEAMFDVANGEIVTPPAPVPTARVLHEQSSRRYHILQNQDELALALEGSLEDWMLFLHPEQRQLVEGLFSGPVQVIGAAGTGKTVVALHRAREMARREARVLLATFTRALAENLGRSLDRLCSPTERSRVTVSTLHSQALQLARVVRPGLQPISAEEMATFLPQTDVGDEGLPLALVLSEWRGVIQPGGITDWAGYRDVSRVGRGNPLRVEERHAIWARVSQARGLAWKEGKLDWAGICGVAARALREGRASSPFQAVLVDEVQDLGVAELGLIRALSQGAPGDLMLFGDAEQRIYGRRSELEQVGLDVAGRVHQLRTNYRTTDAIRRAAEALLGVEEARRSRSLLRGPDPTFHGAPSQEAECGFVLDRLSIWLSQGLHPEEIAILARVDDRLAPLRAELKSQGIRSCGLQEGSEGVRLGTLHSAKGLEFKAVALLGCEDETIPLQYAVTLHLDPLDREAQEEQERHLLYVGMTRAREELAVSWVGTSSRWLGR